MTNLISMTIAILIQVESHGNVGAIGDHGRAIGLTQIHPCIVRECNRIYPQYEFTLNDRYDPWINVEMARIWLSREASRRRITDPVHLAYRWNAPRTGHPAASYLAKIKKTWATIKPVVVKSHR